MGRLFFGGGYDFDIDDSMFPDEYKDNTQENQKLESKPKESEKNTKDDKNTEGEQKSEGEQKPEGENELPRRSKRLKLNSQ